jgi:predicted outer membrane repeat protein
MRHRSFPWLMLAAVVVLASAPRVYAVGVTSCTESAVKSAIATGEASFAADCILQLSSTITLTASTTNIHGLGHDVAFLGDSRVGVLSVQAGQTLNLRGVAINSGFTASGRGGGVVNNGTLNVSDENGRECRFASNKNAILNNGSLTLDNCIFLSNDQSAILNTSSSVALTVRGCFFVRNQGAFGGAINHVGPPGTASISASSFGSAPQIGLGSGPNFGAFAGGAIFVSGTSLTISDSTIVNNSVFDTAAGQGGAIYVSGGTLNINNTSISNNGATQGGAIYAIASQVTVSRGTVNNNIASAGGFGGAIANVGSTIALSDTQLISNNALNSATSPGLGGAIYNAPVTICVGICQFHVPGLTLDRGTLNSNSAAQGGAVYSAGTAVRFLAGSTTVRSTTFGSNSATGLALVADPQGGAIANEGLAQLSVTGSTFEFNSALFKGDEIHNAQGSLNVANSTFNDAGLSGAIFNNAGSAVVAYSTFANSKGPEIVDILGNVTLQGTILATAFGSGNCAGAGFIDGGYNLETQNSCGFKAANNSLINSNPQLGIFGKNGGLTSTFALPTSSPAVDQIPPGTLSCGMSGTAGAIDQRGVPRPQNVKCDMGAVEHLFANLPASGATCNGVYNKTFDGDLMVFPGQNCVFLGGGITGNVQVRGGHFELRDAGVGGNIEVANQGSVALGPAALINGNLEIHDLTSTPTASQVCDATIGGAVRIHNNDAPVIIGAPDQTSCPGNSIGGMLEIHNNSAASSIVDNTVNGDVQDHNNTGPTAVFENLVQGTLACRQNAAITGGQDVASQKQGQCASF